MTLLSFVCSLDAVTVDCEYKTQGFFETYGPLKKVYHCAAKDLRIEGSQATVDKVSGTHLTGKTSPDTKLINIKKIKFERMPKDFNKFFPNLEGIFAHSTGMSIVLKEDLVGFPKLRYLDMSFNKIKTLPSNLFEGNPEVEWIDFSDNLLRHIGVNLLNPLTKLDFANFESNTCVDRRAQDRQNLRELSLELRKVSCKLNDV